MDFFTEYMHLNYPTGLYLSSLAVHFHRRDDGASGKDSGPASSGSQSWLESTA